MAPLVLGGLIAAGGSLLSQGLNISNANATNKKQLEWQEKMYDRQRQDSLSDWNMQNAYNSPTAQMARLKEAGLNPHLVYGNGATTLAQPMASSSAPFASLKAPQADLGSAIAAYQNFQMQGLQMDNLRKQGDVLEAEKLAKLASVTGIEADSRFKSVMAGLEEGSLPYSLEARRLSVEQQKKQIDNLSAQTQNTLSTTETQELMRQPNLQQAMENILNSRKSREMSDAQMRHINEQINQLRKDGTIKDFEIELNKNGFSKSDPVYYRLGTKLLGNIIGGQTVKEAVNKVKEEIKSIKNITPKKAGGAVYNQIFGFNPFQ